MKTLSKFNVLVLFSAVVVTAALTAYGADAATNWSDHCAKCHGADGKGDTKMGHKLSIGDFTDAAVQAKFTDADAVKAIKTGVTDDNGKTRMKAIDGLTDDEVNALVAHVRTLKK
jgi:cytochrome c553